MNKAGLIKAVTEILRERGVRKQVHVPKQVYSITDGDGNTKSFSVKSTDKSVIYTKEDVSNVINACLLTIENSLKQGESISVYGFGSLGVKYRKPRRTKLVGTDREIEIDGRYIPKFTFGDNLRACAKVYEEQFNGKINDLSEYDNIG